MSADVTCPECSPHDAHPGSDCLEAVFNEMGDPVFCGCPPRCPECDGWGRVVTPDQREHVCRDCRGTGEAAA